MLKKMLTGDTVLAIEYHKYLLWHKKTVAPMHNAFTRSASTCNILPNNMLLGKNQWNHADNE